MSLVCFDTQVLIWGIKKEASENQEDMIDRAEYLIEQCEEKQNKIIVPSIVVAELLMGTSSAKHEKVIQVLEKRFIIPPFDLQASAFFAKIWRQNKAMRKALIAEGLATRAELKADSMIVATAVARKAWCIYSMDPHIKKFADGFVSVLDIPELPNEPTQLGFL